MFPPHNRVENHTATMERRHTRRPTHGPKPIRLFSHPPSHSTGDRMYVSYHIIIISSHMYYEDHMKEVHPSFWHSSHLYFHDVSYTAEHSYQPWTHQPWSHNNGEVASVWKEMERYSVLCRCISVRERSLFFVIIITASIASHCITDSSLFLVMIRFILGWWCCVYGWCHAEQVLTRYSTVWKDWMAKPDTPCVTTVQKVLLYVVSDRVTIDNY